MEKFTNHPIRVSSNPNGYGQIVAQLRHELPGPICNNNRNNQGWKNHGNA
ncbi:MAG: hypothetical protein K2W79_04225 [Hydrotalea flava]|nr:hypothetical protein [Hydrotalea lipotrueae]MBY0347444.1 hypothetical protein [Hydrotalea flava]